MGLYAPETAIVERLTERLRATLDLAAVLSHAGAEAAKTALPLDCVIVAAAPFVVRDADAEGSVLIESRWQVTAAARAYNDGAHASRARDRVGEIALGAIQNLIGWEPVAGFGPLLLRSVPGRIYDAGRVFAPLVFATHTTVEAT